MHKAQPRDAPMADVTLTFTCRGVSVFQAVKYDDRRWCPLCWRFSVVVLPALIVGLQPDNTTHVCHPELGGCNHGFGPNEET